eukprot:CAMPEP_0172719654 /NCGR_PEP_ID=MMETSP1074-20121228/75632_1 /TAXON_ID=2916 /ORGANISM="Ceratium fusus, Strain PA161109" /LENGTH=154 /DNA_ID=CAMNT_0013545033 /DNA_START=174 /DNA_END=638 /DNA_ORIENTATION=-
MSMVYLECCDPGTEVKHAKPHMSKCTAWLALAFGNVAIITWLAEWLTSVQANSPNIDMSSVQERFIASPQAQAVLNSRCSRQWILSLFVCIALVAVLSGTLWKAAGVRRTNMPNREVRWHTLPRNSPRRRALLEHGAPDEFAPLFYRMYTPATN